MNWIKLSFYSLSFDLIPIHFEAYNSKLLLVFRYLYFKEEDKCEKELKESKKFKEKTEGSARNARRSVVE